MTRAVVLALLAGFAGALAGQEYRDPAGMDQAERQQVYQAQADYQDCMRSHIKVRARKDAAPLQLADAAMKVCAPVLEQLHDALVAQGYSPQVAAGFTHRLSTQTARRVLADVMRIMAMLQAEEDASGSRANPETAVKANDGNANRDTE